MISIARKLSAIIDRVRWARQILAADVVDTAYASAQLGRRVGARSATMIYVWRGFQQGFRLNPLFVDEVVGDHLPGAFRIPALYAYLINDPRGVQVSPLWDAVAYLRAHPERADEPGGALGAVWRRRAEEAVPFGPDHDRVERDWPVLEDLVREAAAAARRGSPSAAPSRGETPARDELLVVFADDEPDFDESLAELGSTAANGLSVAIAVTGRIPEHWVQAVLLAATARNVRAVLRPGIPPLQAMDELVRSSSASGLVLRSPQSSLSAEAALALAERARAGIFVAPLWVDADGTIAGVGAARDGRILAGHPIEDARTVAIDGVVRVPALAGSTFAAPRTLLSLPLHDGDTAAWSTPSSLSDAGAEILVDAIVRSRVPVAPAHLPPISAADDLLQTAGWTRLAHARSGWRRADRVTRLADGREVPALRWALRTAAPSGPRAEWWGDTHFARGLAAALRRLGQEVVIDAYPARDRATSAIDDVTVVLRGPERIDPPRSGISLLWVISHPDEIGPAALEGFAQVFAASEPWAREKSVEFGRDIRPLLQCTDVSRFRPTGIARGRDIVFVGTARGILRPSVVSPVRAGIPVQVFGPDWREWIPANAIAGSGVPNSMLPALYESAGVVLNDHWPAMKRYGFIANRPYDVIAAGGRVISDDVEGIDELFAGALVTYRDTEELIALLRGDLDAVFPDEAELARVSARVRERDSFDARAEVLLEAALNLS